MATALCPAPSKTRTRLLPVVHFQVVFTLADRPLEPFFRKAPRRCLTLLFRAVAETLAEVAASNLGIDLGFTAVLHTWNQALTRYHPHVHCLVPAGGLSLDGQRWIGTPPHFFLPVDVLAEVFRGKLLSWLEQALRAGEISVDLQKGFISYGSPRANGGRSTSRLPSPGPATWCATSRAMCTASPSLTRAS